MKKKILFINFDNNNPFIKNFIKNISKNHSVTFFSNNKITKNYKFIKNNEVESKLFLKLINFFSNIRNSKDKYYFKYKCKNNFFYFVFGLIKLFFLSINILPEKDTIYKKNFQSSNKYKKLLTKFDLIICDFRLNSLYNQNKTILYEAIKSKNTKLIAWIYSWDNIFQDSVILSANYFLTWTKKLKKILVSNHNINKNKIEILQPVQFQYLKKFKKKKTKNNYILFACSYGEDNSNTGDNFVLNEIEFIKSLSKILIDIKSNTKILVRPYPSSRPNIFKEIKNLKNVSLIEYGKLQTRRTNYSEKIRFEKNELNKFKQIINSKIVISFASTFNIESSFLDKIILHINFSTINNNYNDFRNSMDYLKILANQKYPNVINSELELKNVLYDILKKNNNSRYKKYNFFLKEMFLDKFNQINFDKQINNIINKIC